MTEPGHRWLRDAIRDRVLLDVLIAAVAAVAVLAAVSGPLLVRAVAQQTIHDMTAAAGPDATAVTASSDFSGDDPSLLIAATTRSLAAVSTGAGAGHWTAPTTWTESTENIAWAPAGVDSAVEQVSRVRLDASTCPGLVLTGGRCPTATGEVAVSQADARKAGAELGSTVSLRPPSTSIGPGTAAARVEVVGIYDDDRSRLPASLPAGTNDGALPTSSPIVMTVAQTAALRLSVQVQGRVDLVGDLRLQDEPTVRASVAAVSAAVLQEQQFVTVASGLPTLLDRVDERIGSATVLVAVTEIQVVALGLFALAVVLQRVALTRAAEWGIGRLRGVPRRQWYASIYVEPAAALVLGSLLGFGAGVLSTRLVVTASLDRSIPVEPGRWPVLVAAAAVLIAFLLALVAVSGPSLRRPLIELIQQRSESRGLSVGSAVGQSAVALLAAATVYQLLTGGVLGTGGSQLGLLAPALLALTLALATVRVAVLVVRRVTARAPRRLGALVVGRQAARTPSSLNPAVVVATGMALAVFSTQLFVVSGRNQDLRAQAAVGARTVLHVDTPAGQSLLSIVRAADPSGRYAMAARERAITSDSGVSRILAVDAARFGATATAGEGTTLLGAGADVTALAPRTPDPVVLTGSSVQVLLADAGKGTAGSAVARGSSTVPSLVMTVQTQDQWVDVDLGTIDATSPRSAALPCTAGCRLVRLALRSAAGSPFSARVTVTGIATDREPASASQTWLRDEPWHALSTVSTVAAPRAQVVPTSGATGLALDAFDEDGGSLVVALPPDASDPLPAIVASSTAPVPFPGVAGAAVGRGLDGGQQVIHVVASGVTLPRLLDDGVLVDLGTAEKLADPAQGGNDDQVWLAAGAPAEFETALTAAGLRVTSREDLTAEEKALHDEPSTRAAEAAAILGLTALLLTLVALVTARAADVARRRPDWKSLLDGGLARPVVRRLALTEIAVPVLAAVVLGTASGVLGFVLAAPRLPLVELTDPGPPLDLDVAWTPVVVLAGAVLVVVLAVSWVASRIETRTGGRR